MPPENSMPSVSIIIPTYRGAPTIEKAVECALSSIYPGEVEIIVVDNDSDESTKQAIGRLSKTVKVVRSETNLGFAGGNNLGFHHSTGEIIVLLNDDTEVRPDWLKNLVSGLLESPDIGMTGSLILEADGKTIQHAGSQVMRSYLNTHILNGHPLEDAPSEPEDRDFLMGAALALRRELYEALGGLAECYFPGYYEDMELCHRIRQVGFRLRLIPSAVLVHREKQTLSDTHLYLRIYHRHRWFFIIRNISASGIVKAGFHEIKWFRDITRWKDYRHHRPLFRAYGETIVKLPILLRSRFNIKKINRQLKGKFKQEIHP